MELGVFEEGVYDVVHVPVASVHAEELNKPPAPPSSHDTEPVGEVGVLELSVTVALNAIAVPDTKVPEFGVTATDVVCIEDIVSDNVEELV